MMTQERLKRTLKQMYTWFGVILAPFLTVGCTQGHESFSTEPGKGYGWTDMTSVHTEIQGAITHDPLDAPSAAVPAALPVTARIHPVSLHASALTEIARVPEHSMKIWFAPYQDASGNLHEECAVHTVTL